MNNQQLKWGYLIVLSLVWGSSFILMKKALVGLTPIQLGALRVLITAVFLTILGYRKIKTIKPYQWKWVLLSALLGTFFPAFLYAFAVVGIDSSIASILNSITPFNALWIGAVFFGFLFKKKQLIGIFIGLLGTVALLLEGADLNPNQNYWYAVLPIISSFGYATNVNIIKKYLQDLEAVAITAGNFVLLIIPALIVLYFSDFFTTFTWNEKTTPAMGYVVVLALVGTGMAKIIFNRLIQISSPIFSTSVTYLIPVVAVAWGVYDGEKVSLLQLLSAGVILFGVYLVNKKK